MTRRRKRKLIGIETYPSGVEKNGCRANEYDRIKTAKNDFETLRQGLACE
jgi:hypothetical protein